MKKLLIILFVLAISSSSFAEEVSLSKDAKAAIDKIDKDKTIRSLIYNLQRENIILRDFIEQKMPGWTFNGEKFTNKEEKTN